MAVVVVNRPRFSEASKKPRPVQFPNEPHVTGLSREAWSPWRGALRLTNFSSRLGPTPTKLGRGRSLSLPRRGDRTNTFSQAENAGSIPVARSKDFQPEPNDCNGFPLTSSPRH